MKSPRKSVAVPDIYADRLAAMSPEDKQQLRSFLASPLYVKFLRIVACRKPSANCTGAGSLTRDQFSNDRANARLAEIRGWELYEAAMFFVMTEEPKVPRTAVDEDFPESGRFQSEAAPVVPALKRKYTRRQKTTAEP